MFYCWPRDTRTSLKGLATAIVWSDNLWFSEAAATHRHPSRMAPKLKLFVLPTHPQPTKPPCRCVLVWCVQAATVQYRQRKTRCRALCPVCTRPRHGAVMHQCPPQCRHQCEQKGLIVTTWLQMLAIKESGGTRQGRLGSSSHFYPNFAKGTTTFVDRDLLKCLTRV